MASVERKPRPKPIPPGRAKLTRPRGEAICSHLAKGIPVSAAARACGVSSNTVFEWVRRGCGEDDRSKTPLTEWFAGAFSKAIADCHVELASELREGAKTSERLLMFMLERRFPEDWARPEQRIELTGAGGGPIEIKLAFDRAPIPARPRAELGGPVIDVEAEEIL